jgi:hypothetical protein
MERCNGPTPNVALVCKERWWDKEVTALVWTGDLVHFPVDLSCERLLPTSDSDVDSYSSFGIDLVEQLCALNGMIQIPVHTETKLIN